MYHIKYSKSLYFLKDKIKTKELKQFIQNSKDIDEFIGSLGDSLFEIDEVLKKEKYLNYVLIEYEYDTVRMYTRTKTFVINTEDLLFDEGNVAGLEFANHLIKNVKEYDLVVEFI